MDKAPQLLFVDDEPSIRTLLSTILKQRGFEVTAASSVAEALALIASRRFDILLSDLNIGEPGDGFTVVSAMRRTQPDAATFILTGYPAFESALEAIRQQVDDYFVKPADVDGMVDRIRGALTNARTERPRIQPRRLKEVLQENKREILSRWLAAASVDEQICATRLTDNELTDHLPLLIDEILGTPQEQKLPPKAIHAAQQHGSNRARQGCSIPSMIREARILHEVVSRLVNENLLAVEISYLITDIMAVGETIQAFLEESIRSFVNARQTDREAVGTQKGASILLLSPDRELSLLRGYALQRAGFSVARADSRLHALELLGSSFDALVITYSFPTESLVEFARLFRDSNPGSPIIAVVREHWHDLKIDVDFAVNGDDGPEALLEVVDTAVNRSRLRRVK